MINTLIPQIKARKYFYRGYYRYGLNGLIILLSLELVLTFFVLYKAADNRVPAFFASSSDGILTPLSPMSEPNRSEKALMD